MFEIRKNLDVRKIHLYKNQFSNEVCFICFFSFSEGRSCHPELSDGGAFQVSLSQLQVDCYPYHLATGDRSSWIRYNSESSVHTGTLACLFVNPIPTGHGLNIQLSRDTGR